MVGWGKIGVAMKQQRLTRAGSKTVNGSLGAWNQEQQTSGYMAGKEGKARAGGLAG